MSVRIGLLSDTHSYLDPAVFTHFADCDEVWHAGDVGDVAILDELEAFRPVRAVYGNIDDSTLRRRLPLDLIFTVEGLRVMMTHIGGYPGRYTPRVRTLLDTERPGLYICGHSHILKVMPDKKRNLLHMNPGACGRHGFHRMRTLLRFTVGAGRVSELEAIELGLRGAVPPEFLPD
ncbi:metallophosphoesterase family protein [Neolewinella litorea]|uniref:Phosphoesterase n=1 Tax=Neolewinella litorea TaxID=2562452 RepID=A0A4S4NQ51_9BACT|nr:metallophosphoesterase family protein [Neolewinella litorea]THH41257.1 metallophosphoesterase [Neolewinella litorea]